MAAPASTLGARALEARDERPGRLSRWLTRSSIVVASNLALTVAVFVGDWATGIETPFTILYLLPITWSTWAISRALGVTVAMLSTCCIALSLVHEDSTTAPLVWNVAGAMALFVSSVWVVDRLRRYIDHERALRRMAIAQLRHAERLNLIGTLAAGVAHELGTPLNVIAGCAELLAEESPDHPRVNRRVTIILEQVAKVSTIIRRLLDFGRRNGHTRAAVDLAAVARSAAEMLQSTARNRGCAIEVEADSEVWLAGSPPELEQVLSNLIINAVQAMTHGTVRVRVATAMCQSERMACVEVEDRGCGISRDDIGRIFDPFFTTKGVGEGTGLGLSVSYGIVRDHGGLIEVASEVGRGSRFTVLLPLSTKGAPAL